MKWIQVSSSRTLRWERTIRDRHLAGFTGRGEGIYEPMPRQEETTTDGLPDRVQSMKEGGWTLKPGQEIQEEPLTPENSREIPRLRCRIFSINSLERAGIRIFARRVQDGTKDFLRCSDKGLLRPDHARPSERDGAGEPAVRPADRRRRREHREGRRCSRRRSGTS